MLYFAYGSNLNLRHVRRHAPGAKPVGVARLDGYKLVFRRFIDITPDKSGHVWGAVYDISPACERALDAYEGFPTLYRKITLDVEVSGASGQAMAQAMAYVMNEDGVAPPEIAYFTAVVQGYRDWKLDPAPLTKARIAVLHAPKGLTRSPDGAVGRR